MAAKVLLVEDDNNLREIYEARLLAEGYTIVTAKDGEEALSVAKTELPDLIISDVMMPRISGFEMLDILRNTETLKDTKVIMLTALGQADDKTRANSLGADRYLVKSQVTLEDIVKAAHELLEGAAPEATTPAVAPSSPATPEATAPAAAPMATPAPQAMPVAEPPVMSAPTTPTTSAAPVQATPVAPAPTAPQAAPISPAFNPTLGATPAPAAPAAAPVATAPAANPSDDAASTSDEMTTVSTQIDDFVRNAPETTPQADTASAQDDAVLADAVKDLAATAEEPATDAPAAPEETPESPTPEVAPEAPVSAPTPTTETQTDIQNDSAPVANKKIIQPLSPAEGKPGIHELLAREEADGPMPTPGPVAPATTFAPTSGTPMPARPPYGAPVVGDHSVPLAAAPTPAPAPAAPEATSAPAPTPSEPAMPAPAPEQTPAQPVMPTPPTPTTPQKPDDFDPNSISL